MTTKKHFKIIHRAYRLMGIDDVAVRGYFYPGRQGLFFARAAQGAGTDELWLIATAPAWLFNAARNSFIYGRQRFSGLWDEGASRVTRRRSRRRLLSV
jgi:hypothetical protein